LDDAAKDGVSFTGTTVFRPVSTSGTAATSTASRPGLLPPSRGPPAEPARLFSAAGPPGSWRPIDRGDGVRRDLAHHSTGAAIHPN